MGQLQEQYILILVLSGTLIILLLIAGLALFILFYQKRIAREKHLRAEQELVFQNQMINVKLEIEEKERNRIASDLHDSLGSLLWGAKVNSTFIQRTVPLNNEVQDSFQELNQILDESIQTVRRISWELTPEAFQYSGLVDSVRKVCERLNGKGIDVIIKEENSRFWNDDNALQMFRVLQELVNNTIKHSEATSLEIRMNWHQYEFELNFHDNGIGLPQTNTTHGVGLWNISHRVERMKGKIQIGHPPMRGGLEVNIKVPLAT
jgi:signal transduction histidine kinase